MTARLSLTSIGNVLRLDAIFGYEAAEGVRCDRRRPSFFPVCLCVCAYNVIFLFVKRHAKRTHTAGFGFCLVFFFFCHNRKVAGNQTDFFS